MVHADGLRLRLGFDGIAKAHFKLLLNHLLGHSQSKVGPFGKFEGEGEGSSVDQLGLFVVDYFGGETTR